MSAGAAPVRELGERLGGVLGEFVRSCDDEGKDPEVEILTVDSELLQQVYRILRCGELPQEEAGLYVCNRAFERNNRALTVLERACKLGLTGTVQWIMERHSKRATLPVTTVGCVALACENGHLETAKWIYRNFPAHYSVRSEKWRVQCFLSRIIEAGYFDCIEWSMTEIDELRAAKSDISLLSLVRAIKSLRIAMFLYGDFTDDDWGLASDTLRATMVSGDNGAAEYLAQKFRRDIPFSQYLVGTMCGEATVEKMDWYLRQGVTPLYTIHAGMVQAVTYGNIDVLVYLLEKYDINVSVVERLFIGSSHAPKRNCFDFLCAKFGHDTWHPAAEQMTRNALVARNVAFADETRKGLSHNFADGHAFLRIYERWILDHDVPMITAMDEWWPSLRSAVDPKEIVQKCRGRSGKKCMQWLIDNGMGDFTDGLVKSRALHAARSDDAILFQFLFETFPAVRKALHSRTALRTAVHRKWVQGSRIGECMERKFSLRRPKYRPETHDSCWLSRRLRKQRGFAP